MATKERVLDLLWGQEASRIRFTVPASTGTITIDRMVFATVANAIVAGKVRVEPHATFRAGVGAEYDTAAAPAVGAFRAAPSGALRIPPIVGREQAGMVMHECTHAFFDLTQSAIRATEEEAVCYVVNALYFRMTGLTPARWTNEPHKTAKSVADGLLRQYAVGVAGIPAVTRATWTNLVLAVAVNPTYFPDTAGLPRWFFGTDTYTNDG
jgi:hypothetical protein